MEQKKRHGNPGRFFLKFKSLKLDDYFSSLFMASIVASRLPKAENRT